MKNLFLSLAFMLIGLFARANTNEVVTQKAETIQTISEELLSYEVPVCQNKFFV